MTTPQDLAALVTALRAQRQIDMDGCEVAVSRQACDEAADALEAQAEENRRLRVALRQVVDHGLFHDREYLSSDLNGRLDAARAALLNDGGRDE